MLEHLTKEIQEVKENYTDHMTELFFLQVSYGHRRLLIDGQTYFGINACHDHVTVSLKCSVALVFLGKLIRNFIFSQNDGVMMDYLTWKKRPTPQLVAFLKANQLEYTGKSAIFRMHR